MYSQYFALPCCAYLFVVLMLQTACSVAPLSENAADSYRYFDLVAYCKQQATAISGKTVRKTVVLKGERETKQVVIDGQQELSVFSASDLNKPAWRDSYTIDTTFVGDTLQVSYKALSDKLRTQLLRVQCLPPQVVVRISAENRVSNPLYTLTEQLEYMPEKGYIIKSQQKILGIAPSFFDIRVDF
jgi:hypothetical protein